MNSKVHQDLVRAMDGPAAGDFIQGLLGDNDDELQQAIMEGLEALDGCEEFGIEGLPDLHQMEDFNVWLMGRDATRASSPIPPSPPFSPPPVMLYAGNGMYHAVRADYVRWEGRASAMEIAADDSSVMEVVVEEEENSTSELIIISDDELDEKVECEVSRPVKRRRSPSPSPSAPKQRRASI